MLRRWRKADADPLAAAVGRRHPLADRLRAVARRCRSPALGRARAGASRSSASAAAQPHRMDIGGPRCRGSPRSSCPICRSTGSGGRSGATASRLAGRAGHAQAAASRATASCRPRAAAGGPARAGRGTAPPRGFRAASGEERRSSPPSAAASASSSPPPARWRARSASIPGWRSTQARMLVPGLDVRDADPEGDAAWLARLGLFAARRWTPRAALSGADGLWLDLTGVAHLFGGEARDVRAHPALSARGSASPPASPSPAPPAPPMRSPASAASVSSSARTAAKPRRSAALPLAALRLDEDALDRRPPPRHRDDRRAGRRCRARRSQRRFGTTLLRPPRPGARAGPPSRSIRSSPKMPPAILLRFARADRHRRGDRAGDGGCAAPAGRRPGSRPGLGRRAPRCSICERVDGEDQSVAHRHRPRHPRRRPSAAPARAAGSRRSSPGFGIERMRLVAPRVEPLGPQPIAGALGRRGADRPISPRWSTGSPAGSGARAPVPAAARSKATCPSAASRRARPARASPPTGRAWPRPVAAARRRPSRSTMSSPLLPDQPPRRFTWRGRRLSRRRADGPERIHGEWWKRRSARREAVRDYFQVEDEDGAALLAVPPRRRRRCAAPATSAGICTGCSGDEHLCRAPGHQPFQLPARRLERARNCSRPPPCSAIRRSASPTATRVGGLVQALRAADDDRRAARSPAAGSI